jgi:hypothetical protein
MVVDLSPALMAWTTVEYRFAPDILPDITPTFTLTDPSGFPSTWLSWDDTLRCVIGTPGTGEANKTYKATLQYGSEPITWDIDVRTVSTVVPTAGIGCDIDGLNLKLTAISNTPEMMAAHDWKIYSVSTSALVASSTARNPVLAVPAAGLYEITLKITNSNGTAPATRTVIIPEPEPEPEEEEELLKIAAIIVIVIGVILLLIAGAAMSGWGAAAGIVLVGAGLLLYFFVDLSAVDAWILKFFGDRLR